MSNIEHLIENAVIAVEENRTVEYFLEDGSNAYMLSKVKCPVDELWEMAIYIVYTKCEYCDKCEKG